MSATITNQKIEGVSANAMHIRNGNLVVQGIDTTKKLYKERDSNEHENAKGNFHRAYESATGLSTVVVDGGGDFVNYAATSSRATETVNLILPEDSSALAEPFKTNLATMLGSLTPLVTEATADAEYLEPSNDTPLFDFDGSFVYDENGTSFTLTGVTIL